MPRPTSPLMQLGEVYNSFTVVSHADRGPKGGARVVCLCVCGKLKVVICSRIRTGHIKSCGCMKTERTREANKTHGQSRGDSSKLGYSSWKSMRMRCISPTYSSYPNYGGRGIRVCDRWLNSFENFLEDMGPRPSDQHSLDRIDNSGNYCPENCRWATVEQQVNNKRSSIYVEYGGEVLTVGQWAKKLNKCRETLRYRYHKGLSPYEILFGEVPHDTL